MLTEFGKILVFLILGGLFVAGGLIASWLLRPHRPYPGKLSTYECGEEPLGQAWVRFNVRFYVIALVFLIFDVEIVFLFPWALVYRELGLFAFIEMAVFLAILWVGYAYVWVKGDLNWDKPSPQVPTVRLPERRDVRPEPARQLSGGPVEA
ncbi:MAG: NADH-quinone oxidoreductase subunit A [Ignavibacteriales bacterium]|nr:NADH-quinone oxidoreductase subunit A [Ignavibacteriales bacterium]